MTSKIMPIAAAPMALANVTGASGQTVTDLCSPAAMTADVGPVTAETLNYGGTDRYYCTYTSSLIGSGTQQPLLMALHGGNGNAAQMMRDSRRIIANAESGGYIAVFPNGLPRPSWAGASLCANNSWGAPDNVFFIAELSVYGPGRCHGLVVSPGGKRCRRGHGSEPGSCLASMGPHGGHHGFFRAKLARRTRL